MLEEYVRDFAGYCKDVLGATLWQVEEDIGNSVRDNPRTAVAGCHASGKCVAEDERLQLFDGRVVEARSLVGRWFVVPTFDPATGKQEPGMAYAEDNGVKEVFRVTTSKGRVIERTGNHPLWVAKKVMGSRHRSQGHHHGLVPEVIGWRAVQAIEAGDLVLVPKALAVSGQHRADPNVVKLAGYLLGDGGTTTNICFTQEEGRPKDEFREIVASLGCASKDVCDLTMSVSGKSELPNSNFQRGSNHIRNLLREWGLLGCKAINKRFPAWVWELPNNQLALLLNRLFACDGWAYVNENKGGRGARQIAISLASLDMIRDIELAMLRLGIPGNVRHRVMGCNGKKFDAWEWLIRTPEAVNRFAKLVGIYGKEAAVKRVVKSANNLENPKKRQKWRTVNAPPGYQWEEVESIETVGHKPTVAVCVPSHQTFVTTFVEHNTWVAGAIANWWLDTHDPAVVLNTAPTGRQAKMGVFREAKKSRRKALQKLPGKIMSAEIRISDQRFSLSFSADNPDAVQGLREARNVLVIEDEAPGVDDELQEALGTILTDPTSRLLIQGNPTSQSGHFFDAFHSQRDLWNCISISAFDTPNVKAGKDIIDGLVSCEWVETKRRQWGESSPRWHQRVLGQFFILAGASKLISRDWIDAARDRYNPDVFKKRGGTMGVDIAASESGDRTSSYVMVERMIREVETYYEPNLMVNAARIVQRALEYGVKRLVIDETGVGRGCYQEVQRLARTSLPGVEIIGVNLGKSARDPKAFRKVMSELQWEMRRGFDPAEPDPVGIDPNDHELSEQLNWRSWDLVDGQICVETKNKLRQRTGKSPDKADAVMLLFVPTKPQAVWSGRKKSTEVQQ